MKNPTFLFFPLEAGLAHVTRSLAVAEELKKKKNTVYFALPKEKQNLFHRAKVSFIDSKSHGKTNSIDFIKNVQNFQYMLNMATDDLKIIEEVHPDAIVVDARISAMAASLTKNVPTYFITGSAGLPYDIYIPNFFRLPQAIHSALQKPLLKLIRIARERMFIDTIVKLMFALNGVKVTAKEVTARVKFIVPEVSSYLPLVRKRNNVSHVGHLKWDGFNQMAKRSISFKRRAKTIYLTFGGTGFDGSKLIELAQCLVLKGFSVIVSSSTIADPRDFPSNPSLFVSRFVQSKLANKIADIIVCHGGYGTMMDAALAGKPVVSVPFNPDQWLHSIRFQELGMGICTTEANFRFLVNSLLLKWEKVQKLGEEVETSKIISSVEVIIENYDSFRSNINNFISEFPVNNSVNKAVKMILKGLSVNNKYKSYKKRSNK